MKKFVRRTLAVLLLGLVTVSAVPRDAEGQGTPPPIALDVPLILQRTPVWCWLAVSEMAMRYRSAGASFSQCQIMEIGYRLPPGTCCNNPSNCARPATGMQEVQSVLQHFGGVMSVITPPNDPMTLYALLQQDRPVIAQIRTGITSSHVIVLRGMRFVMQPVATPFGPRMTVVPIVLVNDPLSHFPGEVAYPNLMSIWMNSLVVGPVNRPSAPPPQAPSAPPSGDGEEKPPSAPAQPAPSGDFCDALNKVIADLPKLRKVRGEKQGEDEEDHESYYEGKVAIPGTTKCTVWGGTSDSGPRYRCRIVEGDCDAVEERYGRIKSKTSACLVGWKVARSAATSGTQQEVVTWTKGGSGDPKVKTGWHKYSSTGRCTGFLQISTED